MFDHVKLRATNGKFKGEEFVLENECDYTLGRARDCSYVLDDPLRLISRRHCRIEVHAPLVRIQDLGSLNGTQVNGKSIDWQKQGQWFEELLPEIGVEHPLEDGDSVQIAGYDFEVTFEPATPGAEDEPCNQEEFSSCDCVSC